MSAKDWDDHWLEHAGFKAQKSKDRSRKVGCVVVNDDNDEIVSGWNGFPRGVDDDVEHRHQRPAKYFYTEHAERNAFYNAARLGRSTKGARIYQVLYPCSGCARGIIQCGIKEVITIEPDWDDPTYGEEWKYSREMLAERGVVVRFVEGDQPQRKEEI